MSDSDTYKVKVLVFDQYSNQVVGSYYGEAHWQVVTEGVKAKCLNDAEQLRRVYANVKVVKVVEEEVEDDA